MLPYWDQEKINNFYSKTWKSNIHLFKFSGKNIIELANKRNPKLVIDAGCGVNFYKGKIKNLIGFDPVFKEADINCTILDAPFKDKCADVIIAFGPVNWGPEEAVIINLMRLKSWLTPGGDLYMRHAPDGYKADGLDWFKWNTKDIEKYADLCGFDLISMNIEYNETTQLKTRKWPHRYVWHYRRPQ